MSTEVLIELDPSPCAPAVGLPAPPARRYRALGLALCLLLTLAVAGAVPAVTPMWQRTGVVPAVPADSVVEVYGDRLYVSVSSGDGRITTGYGGKPLRRLWSVRTADDVDASARLYAARGGVIVQNGRYTDVLDPRTGAVRWSSPVFLQPMPGGRSTVVVDPQFGPGTEYDESSGAPGMLYFASDGRAHTRPPERTVLRGVDLATGRQRWTTALPGSVYVAPAASQPPTLLVVSSQRLDLLDVDTGAVLRRQPLPANPRRVAAWSEVVGDLVQVSSPTESGDVVHSYSLDTLQPRWQRTVQVDDGNSRTCTGLPCERRSSSLAVLDPATGEVRWETEGWVDLVRWGRSALVYEGYGEDRRPVRVVSPTTGKVQVDLADWQAAAQGPANAPLVLSRTHYSAGTTFGVLRPGQRVVHELGHTDALVQSCRSNEEIVACRTPGGVEVYRYRS